MTAPRDWLLITLDSCRFDSFERGRDRFLTRCENAGRHSVLYNACLPRSMFDPPDHGAVTRVTFERRYAQATWTLPSHLALMTGILPQKIKPEDSHRAPDLYRGALTEVRDSLGLQSFDGYTPNMSLPIWLTRAGYLTLCSVSLPVIAPRTALAWHAWGYHQAMAKHNDIREHIAFFNSITRWKDQPFFWLLNAGETHYPYTTGEETAEEVLANALDNPHLSGLNGVARSLSSGTVAPELSPGWLTTDRLQRYRRAQISAACESLARLEPLIESIDRPTRVTITADHGEAFGEGGWFGHGPVAHEIVLQVPWLDFFVEPRV